MVIKFFSEGDEPYLNIISLRQVDPLLKQRDRRTFKSLLCEILNLETLAFLHGEVLENWIYNGRKDYKKIELLASPYPWGWRSLESIEESFRDINRKKIETFEFKISRESETYKFTPVKDYFFYKKTPIEVSFFPFEDLRKIQSIQGREF